jgi:photosystem II stability/assembly factor-like uncharacterized protein
MASATLETMAIRTITSAFFSVVAGRRRRWLPVLLGLMALWTAPAGAHDPSAYGGLFRSRDLGATWLAADTGLFLNAALTVAVDPRDPNHLWMGTDIGLYESRNGGRSWLPEAQGVVIGAVFAVAFSPDGNTLLCAAPNGVFRFRNGQWRAVPAPPDALPARAMIYSGERIFLLGRDRLFASTDAGTHFAAVNGGLAETAHMTALAASPGPSPRLLAVVDGRLMASPDAGRTWQPRVIGAPGQSAPVNTVAADPAIPGRFWAAMRDRIWRSDDGGRSWRALPAALPEPNTNVRGIAADPAAATLVVSTHRGMYRSTDGGRSWGFMQSRLPVHLEAGPLVRDPTAPGTIYVVYSLMPYPEVWRTAVQGTNLLAQVDPVGIAGGVAVVLLVLMGGGYLVWWLARLRAPRPAPRTPRPPRPAV